MILCIDFGSTSFKAALYTPSLEVAGKGEAYLTYTTFGKHVELEVGQAKECLCLAVSRAFADASATPSQVTAVAVTSQAQTFTLQTTDGKFAVPFISWQDGRARPLATAMGADSQFKGFEEHCSFHQPLGGMMLCLLKQVLTDLPIYRDARVIPLPSFFIEELTGHSVLDQNLAAMTGLYSLKRQAWNEPYLEWCGISEQQLPTVCPSHKPAGATRSGNLLQLSAGIPVFSAGNDQTAGAYAAGLEESGGILITLGSAQVAYQWLPEQPVPLPGTVWGIFPGRGFYRMMADSLGGNLITRAVRQMGLEGFPEFFKLAQHGMRADCKLPAVEVTSDAIAWKDASASDELKAAAVVDFLCDRMAGFVRQLRTDSEPLFLTDGGGARNAVWRDCLAKKLGIELQLKTAAPDFGAARLVHDDYKR
ncbi:MAG: hypothetical protein K9M54_05865 [Kiritimatiellales bacterium]|nr:hypothetical protein [Kiritimatiellales bacterium]